MRTLTCLLVALPILAASAPLCAQTADPVVLVVGFTSGNLVAFNPTSGSWVEIVALQPDVPPGTGDRPRGVAVSSYGLIYISLRGGTQNVKRFWWDGQYAGDLMPPFPEIGPGQIKFAPNGDLIVAGDMNENSSIFRYDSITGTLLDHFNLPDYTNLVGLLVDYPFVYSPAFFQNHVARFDISTTPATGSPFITCCLDRPLGMTFSHRGTIFIASVNGALVQEFDPATGAFLGTFADLSTLGLSFVRDIAYDPNRERYYLTAYDDGFIEMDHDAHPTGSFHTALLSMAYSIVIATPPFPIAIPAESPPAETTSVSVTPNPGSTPVTILVRDHAMNDAGIPDARIYSSDGRLVRILHLSAWTPSQMAFSWDGRNLVGDRSPAGIYYFRLPMRGIEHTAKLVVSP